MKKRGQIWVETTVYTLIALSIIGLVLAFVQPKIKEIQDRAIIEQSITMMENIDSIILLLDESGTGNKRLMEIGIRKGSLEINGIDNHIVFEIDSEDEYSQPGKEISIGNLIVKTDKIGKSNKVTLTRNYNATYNITHQKKEEIKKIPKASTPYKIFISNEGGNPTIIDFELS